MVANRWLRCTSDPGQARTGDFGSRADRRGHAGPISPVLRGAPLPMFIQGSSPSRARGAGFGRRTTIAFMLSAVRSS
jgi:hypothetical protein